MDNSRGDLTDIIRNRAAAAASETADVSPAAGNGWGLLPDPAAGFGGGFGGGFADSFVDSSDPLFHELARTSFFDSSEAGEVQKMMLWEEARRPSGSMFSRMPQVSPGRGKASAAVIGQPPLLAPGGGADEPVEISSPRLMAGIKRRKSQAKKVVCIPAPAVTSGKSSGEVVPSDLWAWRKYGQKPIKGSPYPRGYYRCSSSKGCSARKQVERSRTDPNMLVITYTSEHNHPWPTQRNALAGSTRTQPSKANTSSSTSKNSPRNCQKNFMTKAKEEPKECSSSSAPFAVKEEDAYEEMERAWVDSGDHVFDHAFDESFSMSSMMSESSHPDDFFADLAELDPDPMNIVFPKSLMGDKMDQERKNGSGGNNNKAMNPFDMFDWEERDVFGEERRGL